MDELSDDIDRCIFYAHFDPLGYIRVEVLLQQVVDAEAFVRREDGIRVSVIEFDGEVRHQVFSYVYDRAAHLF